MILLEDLGPKSVPPWTLSLTRNVARAFSNFHQATLGASLPEWLPRPERHFSGIASTWERLVDAEDLPSVADLAGEQALQALRWLESAAPILTRVSRDLVAADPPFAFLHRDARSDNLRWVDGRLRLFDWPHVGVGPAEFDAAAFAQSVTAEDGPGRSRSWRGTGSGRHSERTSWMPRSRRSRAILPCTPGNRIIQISLAYAASSGGSLGSRWAGPRGV